MKYLFLLDGYGPDEHGRDCEGYRAATRAMAEAGVLVDCAPLHPVSSSTTLRIREERTLLTDGPANGGFREPFGGYALVECADLDEALKWAATLPAARAGSVEIRPVAWAG